MATKLAARSVICWHRANVPSRHTALAQNNKSNGNAVQAIVLAAALHQPVMYALIPTTLTGTSVQYGAAHSGESFDGEWLG